MNHDIEKGKYRLTMSSGETVEAEVEYVSPKCGRLVVRLLTPWEPRYDIPADKVALYKWDRID